MRTTESRTRKKSSRILAFATSLLVVATGLIVTPTAANAAAEDVTSSTMNWGFKDSWRNYINMGGGSTEFAGGASATPAPYNWGTGNSGTFDPETRSGSFSLPGSVRWHGFHGIDITMNNVSVDFNLASGTGSIQGAGETVGTFTTASATVNETGGTVSVSNAPVTATAGTEAIFGAFYPAGTVLDPISFTLNYDVAAVATPTTTTLVANATDVEVGTAVELTATVSPAADGTVEFFANGSSIGSESTTSGVATISVTTLAVGANSITAEFSPADAAAFESSATASATVVNVTVPASAVSTTVTLAAPTPAKPVVLGTAVQFVATVAANEVAEDAGQPTGAVEFFSIADGATDRVSLGSADVEADGTANLETDALTAGGHTFVAVFTPAVPAEFVGSEGAYTAHYGVVDTAAPEAYEPGANAKTATGATASWNWSAYSAGWVKTATGNAAVSEDGLTFELTDGVVNADSFGAVISFEATLTNTAYGSIVMSITDPALHLNADGTGVWVASVGESTERIVVGTFTGVDAQVGVDTERVVEFDYADTTAAGTWSVGRTGAWANGFILELASSVRAFYYESGAGSDANKPASPLTVDFDWPAVTDMVLEVTPDAPARLGTEVTFNATVTPPSAEGSVEFFATAEEADAEESLGTADVVDGVATFTTTDLIAGGNTFRAVYTSSNGFDDAEATHTANYGVVDTAQPELCTPAGSSETLTGVSAEWAWSAYSAGWSKIGGGNVTVDDQNFVLSNGVATVSDDCVSVAFTGTLRVEAYGSFFPTHGQWVELVNPVLTVDAAGNGAWSAGVRSGVGELNTTTSEPVAITTVTGADLDFSANSVAATIEFDYAGTTASGSWSAGRDSAWSNGFVLQVPNAVRSFYYSTGAGADGNKPAAALNINWQLADPSVTVNGKSSDARVLQGQNVTFAAEPFREGDVVSVVVNSDPVTLPSVTVANDGVATQTWQVPADFATGSHTVTFTSGSGNDVRSASMPFIVEATSTTPGGDDTEDVDVCIARSVTGGSMSWEFKQSFKNYILGPIAHGEFSGGSFSASGGAINVEAGGIGTVNFAGSLSATGHGGELSIQISNPTVQITGPNTGVLYGNMTASGSTSYIAIANLAFSSVSVSGSTLTVVGSSATLTGAAAAAFNGFYGAGSALDTVSFSVSLGGEVDCDSSTDPVELAQTGAAAFDLQGMALSVLAFGALVLLAGIVVTRSRRREVAQR